MSETLAETAGTIGQDPASHRSGEYARALRFAAQVARRTFAPGPFRHAW